jgi:hypothetical protein
MSCKIATNPSLRSKEVAMVIEVLVGWGRVFEQLRKMYAADLIDGFSLEYPSNTPSKLSMRTSFYTLSSSRELDMIGDELPRTFPEFCEFAIEKSEETIGGRKFRTLKVTVTR